MNAYIIPLEFSISDGAFFGFLILLVVPVLLLTTIILAIAKKKKAAKKALIITGVCFLIGIGLCGLG